MFKKTITATFALTLLWASQARAQLTAPLPDPTAGSCSTTGTCPDGSQGSCSAEGRWTSCKGQYNNEGPTCWFSNTGKECNSNDTGCTKISGCKS